MTPDLVQRIARVQELCETLTLPETTRHQFGVTFADGSHANMRDVLAEGREALAEVAAFFEVDVPAVCLAEAAPSVPSAEAVGHAR